MLLYCSRWEKKRRPKVIFISFIAKYQWQFFFYTRVFIFTHKKLTNNFVFNHTCSSKMACPSGGFRGGTAGSCPPPPLLKHFSIHAPLFVHVPPLLKPKKKKKKKKCLIPPGYTPVATYPPPPPRRRWRSGKKSVGVPPPPSRLSAFLGLARVSRLAAHSGPVGRQSVPK